MGSPAVTKPTQWGRRPAFYTIRGRQLPSVTTILDVIAKPALGPWYARRNAGIFEAGHVGGSGAPRSPPTPRTFSRL